MRAQSDWYFDDEGGENDEPLQPSYAKGLKEAASLVTFNGREGSLTDKPLVAKQGERVRIWCALAAAAAAVAARWAPAHGPRVCARL
jgi:hypothetical protein